MNGLPAPRRRREHQSPAGSGAARTQGKEGGEARERVSARERPGKRRRNWARRAAASPRASCGSGSSEGGGAAAPRAALRARKVACQRGQAARKERGERSGPSSDLAAPRSPAAASTSARRRAEATHRPPPRLRGPRRARVSSSDPTPQPRFGSPTREHSAVPLCQGCPHHVPAPPRGQWRGSCLSALPPPAQPTSTAKPEEGPKGFRAAYRDRRVEVRSSRGTAAAWGSPSSSRVANLKLSLPEPPARAAGCRSSRRFGEAGGRETGERRSRRPGRERGRRAGGVCPGARQAAAAPGKVISALRGVAPRAGAAQVQLGRAWAPARGPGAKPGPSGRDGGAPSGAGSRLGMEGGAETVKWRGAGRSAREPRGAGAVGLAAPGPGSPRCIGFPGRSGACSRKGQGAAPRGPGRSTLPVPRPPRRWLCPGRAGTTAPRLQCPLVGTPVRAQAAKAELRGRRGSRWPSEQVQSALQLGTRSELMQVEVRGNTRESSGRG